MAPSDERTPAPPCWANAAGPSAAAAGAATRAARTSARAKRRGVMTRLRTPPRRRSLRLGQLPGRAIHRAPRRAGGGDDAHRRAVDSEAQVPEAGVGAVPRQPDAVRDAAHGVERVDERIAARVRVERVLPASVRRAAAADGPPLH